MPTKMRYLQHYLQNTVLHYKDDKKIKTMITKKLANNRLPGTFHLIRADAAPSISRNTATQSNSTLTLATVVGTTVLLSVTRSEIEQLSK